MVYTRDIDFFSLQKVYCTLTLREKRRSCYLFTMALISASGSDSSGMSCIRFVVIILSVQPTGVPGTDRDGNHIDFTIGNGIYVMEGGTKSNKVTGLRRYIDQLKSRHVIGTRHIGQY
jgi:hypothetical protein